MANLDFNSDLLDCKAHGALPRAPAEDKQLIGCAELYTVRAPEDCLQQTPGGGTELLFTACLDSVYDKVLTDGCRESQKRFWSPPPPYRNCLKIVLSVLVSRVEGRILKPKEFEILSSF